MSSTAKTCITKQLLENVHTSFPKFSLFSTCFFLLEAHVFAYAKALTTEKIITAEDGSLLTIEKYCGGTWDFYKLSNGGFYMAPNMDEAFYIEVSGNGYEGKMSADTFGVFISMFVFSNMSFPNQYFSPRQREQLGQLYHLLRDFACEHVDAAQIFRACD